MISARVLDSLRSAAEADNGVTSVRSKTLLSLIFEVEQLRRETQAQRAMLPTYAERASIIELRAWTAETFVEQPQPAIAVACLDRMIAGTDLGVFTDGTDTVVAHDKEDVKRVIIDHAGSFESDLEEFVRYTDDHVLAIKHVDMPDGDDGKISLTCREWIAKHGRGFLCSTEY